MKKAKSIFHLMFTYSLVLGLILLTAPVFGANFEYVGGTFYGQGGISLEIKNLILPTTCEDNWLDTWIVEPDLNSVTARVHKVRCKNLDVHPLGLFVDATVMTRQEGLVDIDGQVLNLWNHGQVKAIASAPRGRWNVFASDDYGRVAHADSGVSELAFEIVPDPDDYEVVGDPVWLCFNSDYFVNHSIGFQFTRAHRHYSQWTDLTFSEVPEEDSKFELQGLLVGPDFNPFTVFLKKFDTDEIITVLQAKEDYDHSSIIFRDDLDYVEAQIGDQVIFDGGVLPWLRIDTEVPAGLPFHSKVVWGSETATSDMTLKTRVRILRRDSGDPDDPPDNPCAWWPPLEGAVINETFAVGQTPEELGFEVNASTATGTASIVASPDDPEDDGVLWMQDPVEGAVAVSKPISVEAVLKVELEYQFQLPGKLEIKLEDVVLDTIHAEGPSTGFVFYSKEFALVDYGLTPSPPDRIFTLKLSNPEAVDPSVYLDNLLVSTSPNYTGNAPPSRPILLSPTEEPPGGPTPALEIANATDENGDAIRYTFEIYADSELTTLAARSADVEPGPTGTTVWTVDEERALEEGTYYWRAIATDQIGASSVSTVNRLCVTTCGEENRPPVAVCRDVTATADDLCQSNVEVDNGSYDPDGDQFTIAQSPPGPYGLGSTDVTLTVTDDKGASDSCDATVTVEDETRPEVIVSATNDSLWPPNHEMVDVGLEIDVFDSCDPNPLVSVGVTSDERTSTAPGAGGPQHAPDAEIATNQKVFLRAERSGEANGRVYVTTVSATDGSGNIASSNTSVKVNLNKNTEATDSGQLYDATKIN